MVDQRFFHPLRCVRGDIPTRSSRWLDPILFFPFFPLSFSLSFFGRDYLNKNKKKRKRKKKKKKKDALKHPTTSRHLHQCAWGTYFIPGSYETEIMQAVSCLTRRTLWCRNSQLTLFVIFSVALNSNAWFNCVFHVLRGKCDMASPNSLPHNGSGPLFRAYMSRFDLAFIVLFT